MSAGKTFHRSSDLLVKYGLHLIPFDLFPLIPNFISFFLMFVQCTPLSPLVIGQVWLMTVPNAIDGQMSASGSMGRLLSAGHYLITLGPGHFHVLMEQISPNQVSCSVI